MKIKIKFPNLDEDQSSNSHQFRPHCVSRFSTPLCLFVPIFSLRALSSFATTIVYSTYLDSLHSKDSFLDNEKHSELDKANSKTKDLF